MWSKEKREEKKFQEKRTTDAKTLRSADGTFDEHKVGEPGAENMILKRYQGPDHSFSFRLYY